jgi:predicted nucleic acid-binding protein
VVDASAVLAVVLDEEPQDYALAVGRYMSRRNCVTPPLFWFEFGNSMLTAVKKGRISAEQADDAISKVRRQPITTDESHLFRDVYCLAQEHGLTFDDAAYLELTLRRKLWIATLDQPLQRAVIACGGELFTS